MARVYIVSPTARWKTHQINWGGGKVSDLRLCVKPLTVLHNYFDCELK